MIGWYFLLVGIAIIFIVLHVVVLPKLFLRLSNRSEIGDRGVKNINEEGGHTIIYSPRVAFRRYLKHYAISKRNDKLTLACDFNRIVNVVDYDVSLINGTGKVFKVLNIKQRVIDGESETISLPDSTAYVSISINSVNGNYVDAKRDKDYSVRNITLFLVCTSVVEFFVFLGIKSILANILGGIFAQSFNKALAENWLMYVIAVAAIFLNDIITIVLMAVGRHRRKIHG